MAAALQTPVSSSTIGSMAASLFETSALVAWYLPTRWTDGKDPSKQETSRRARLFRWLNPRIPARSLAAGRTFLGFIVAMVGTGAAYLQMAPVANAKEIIQQARYLGPGELDARYNVEVVVEPWKASDPNAHTAWGIAQDMMEKLGIKHLGLHSHYSHQQIVDFLNQHAPHWDTTFYVYVPGRLQTSLWVNFDPVNEVPKLLGHDVFVPPTIGPMVPQLHAVASTHPVTDGLVSLAYHFVQHIGQIAEVTLVIALAALVIYAAIRIFRKPAGYTRLNLELPRPPLESEPRSQAAVPSPSVAIAPVNGNGNDALKNSRDDMRENIMTRWNLLARRTVPPMETTNDPRIDAILAVMSERGIRKIESAVIYYLYSLKPAPPVAAKPSASAIVQSPLNKRRRPGPRPPQNGPGTLDAPPGPDVAAPRSGPDFIVNDRGAGGDKVADHAVFNAKGEFQKVLIYLAAEEEASAFEERADRFDFRALTRATLDHRVLTLRKGGEIRTEEDGLSVIIDNRFQLNHAGRNAFSVYAQNPRKALHEAAELRAWARFALRYKITSAENILDGKLGDDLRAWMIAQNAKRPWLFKIRLWLLRKLFHFIGLFHEWMEIPSNPIAALVKLYPERGFHMRGSLGVEDVDPAAPDFIVNDQDSGAELTGQNPPLPLSSADAQAKEIDEATAFAATKGYPVSFVTVHEWKTVYAPQEKEPEQSVFTHVELFQGGIPGNRTIIYVLKDLPGHPFTPGDIYRLVKSMDARIINALNGGQFKQADDLAQGIFRMGNREQIIDLWDALNTFVDDAAQNPSLMDARRKAENLQQKAFQKLSDRTGHRPVPGLFESIPAEPLIPGWADVVEAYVTQTFSDRRDWIPQGSGGMRRILAPARKALAAAA